MGGLFSERRPSKAEQPAEPPPPAREPAAPGIVIVPEEDPGVCDIKIILLGPGECGKSTYWRQIRFIYCGGLPDDEIELLIPGIRLNIIKDIKILIAGARELNFDIASELKSDAETIEELMDSDDELVPEIAQRIFQIWKDVGIQTTFKQIESNRLSDHTSYFLDHVVRIADPSYKPTEDDILKSRVRTTGVNEGCFKMNEKHVKIVDVGGQLAERKKWPNAIKNVSAILFVVSLADFDQRMFEGEGMRTEDALRLFKTIAANQAFRETPFLLVLNKCDELVKKVSQNPHAFRQTFPQYEGSMDDFDAIVEFVGTTYVNQLEGMKQVEYVATCAVDKEKVKSSFSWVAERVLRW